MNMNTDDWDSFDWEIYYNLSAMGEEPATAYRVQIRFFDGYLGEEGMSVVMASGPGLSDDEDKYFWSLDDMPFEKALEFYSEENSPEDWYIVTPTGGPFDDNDA